MWNRSSTYQRLYSNFQRKISLEKKVKDQIRKIASPKKHPMKNLPKIWVYTNHVIFLKELSRLEKLHFLMKEYIRTDISDWVWRNIFGRLFTRSFFLRPRKNYPARKTPPKLKSLKIQVKSGEIPVRKKVGKIM